MRTECDPAERHVVNVARKVRVELHPFARKVRDAANVVVVSGVEIGPPGGTQGLQRCADDEQRTNVHRPQLARDSEGALVGNIESRPLVPFKASRAPTDTQLRPLSR